MKPEPYLRILWALLQAAACLILFNTELYSQKRPKDHIVKWDTEPNEVCPKVSIGAEAGIFVPTDDKLNDAFGVSFTPALSASYYFNKNLSLQLRQSCWYGTDDKSSDMISATSKTRTWPLIISGYYHYPFRDGHFALYAGGGTGVVFGMFKSKITTFDPHTYEWVTTTDKESKTGWDVHASTGLQYCITPNLEVNLNLNYAYQPISDWDFDMGGFAVTVGVGYNFSMSSANHEGESEEGVSYLVTATDQQKVDEETCDCILHSANIRLVNVDISNVKIGSEKVDYERIEIQFYLVDDIACDNTDVKLKCYDVSKGTITWLQNTGKLDKDGKPIWQALAPVYLSNDRKPKTLTQLVYNKKDIIDNTGGFIYYSHGFCDGKHNIGEPLYKYVAFIKSSSFETNPNIDKYNYLVKATFKITIDHNCPPAGATFKRDEIEVAVDESLGKKSDKDKYVADYVKDQPSATNKDVNR
jgi:opacity protein-like surface antigen